MRRRVLTITPSISLRKVVDLALSSHQIEVLAAGDGRVAVETIREARPDLVLCDIALPEKDGYEVCRAVKTDPTLSHIPVLLLAGPSESFDAERAKRVGAAGLLPKPVEPEALADKVRELLGSKSPPAAWPTRRSRGRKGVARERGDAPPTRLPPTPRRVRSRSWSRGVGGFRWFMRLFMLPHTYIGLRMIVGAVGAPFVSAYGIDVPGIVAAKEEEPGPDTDTTYVIRYTYTVDGAEYRASAAVAGTVYEWTPVGRPVRVRALRLLPGLSPLLDLEGPPPRVALAHLLIALFCNGILAFFVWLCWILPWREQRLLRFGTAVAGEIVAKEVDTSGEDTVRRVRYIYETPSPRGAGNEPREGVITLDDGVAEPSVGDTVTVLFDPLRPERSQVYELAPYRVRGAEEVAASGR